MWDIYAVSRSSYSASGTKRHLLMGPYEHQNDAWEASQMLNTLAQEYPNNKTVHVVSPCKHVLIGGISHTRPYISGPISSRDIEALKAALFT